MRSVADSLRASQVARMLALPPAKRVAEALALGQRDLRAYQRARGVDAATALRELRHRRQVGRRPSVASD